MSKDIQSFAIRCESKGGVALTGIKPGVSNKWVGCYKTITEIENESKE